MAGKDLFHFAVLFGKPPEGTYDWFKIARRPAEDSWHLVAASNEDNIQWVEPGKLTKDASSGIMHFTIQRDYGGEGYDEKNVREFEWKEGDSKATITVKDYNRFFLNPVWGEPRVLRVTVSVSMSDKESPNQSPEPTPTSVTPRADARVAPAAGVAHL